jgi:hypothetical protein
MTVHSLQVTIADLCSEPTSDMAGEPPDTLSQDEVDKDAVEMTCGARLEEHFWPIRYQIRHGQLHVRFVLNSIQSFTH